MIFVKVLSRLWGPHGIYSNGYWGVSPGLNWPYREANHWSPRSPL